MSRFGAPATYASLLFLWRSKKIIYNRGRKMGVFCLQNEPTSTCREMIKQNIGMELNE